MEMRVNRMRLPQGDTPMHHLAFSYEDALRTEVEDQGRLIVVRQLRIRSPLGRSGPATQVAKAWHDVRESACHGANASAFGQNAIWFHDAEEAALLLLERRLSGRDVSAWFWRLAVPGGVSLSVAIWVGQMLQQQVQAGSVNASVRLLTVVAAHADDQKRALIIERLLTLFAPVSLSGKLSAALAEQHAAPLSAPCERSEQADPLLVADVRIWLTTDAIVGSLRQPLRLILRRLVSVEPSRSLAIEIFTALVLQNVRVLNIGQIHHDQLISSLILRLRGATAQPTLPRLIPPPTPSQIRAMRKGQTDISSVTPPIQLETESPDSLAYGLAMPIEASVSASFPTDVPVVDIEPVYVQSIEIATRAAGLYLTLLPLWHLDWPAFVARRPDWFEHDPTAQLLAHILQRHRLGDDPAGRYWLDQATKQQLKLPVETLEIWRVGLDRWLRRRTGNRLAHLLGRRGWVLVHNESITVRFPADAVDIRLRRLALDRDLGWLDWLGHSVRFVYSDRPSGFGGAVQ